MKMNGLWKKHTFIDQMKKIDKKMEKWQDGYKEWNGMKCEKQQEANPEFKCSTDESVIKKTFFSKKIISLKSS